MPDSEPLISGSGSDVHLGAAAGPATVSRAALWLAGLGLCSLTAALLLLGSGQRQHGYFVIVAAYALAGVATFNDVALRKVPNSLTYPALLLALVLNGAVVPLLRRAEWTAALVWLGAPGMRPSLLGLGLCALVGIISFAARGLGGGDVKLLAALGALVGLDAILPILVNTLVVASVVGLVNLAAKGLLFTRLQSLGLWLFGLAVTRRFVRPRAFSRTESPFCFSLLLGMVSVPFFNVHHSVMQYLRGL